MSDVFDPIVVGGIELPNRIFVAPCTRNRAAMDETPTAIMTEYYRQRASAGLIIAEGINPEARGRGYHRVPGAFTDEQQAGWKAIADAVHAEGGHIAGQIMHCGRLSYPELQPGHADPIAPSAVRPDPDYRGYAYGCPKPAGAVGTPRALELAEIPLLIDAFAEAARRLVTAGLDAVELHAASGYLPMQFLSSNTNRRDDAYGGNIPRRARFLFEVVDALIGAVGPGRVAVKLAPGFRLGDIHDEDPVGLYAHVAQNLSDRGLAYVQVSDYRPYYSHDFDPIHLVRSNYRGVLVANGGFDLQKANAALAGGRADAISFGVAYIANPDLVERFRRGHPLNRPDSSTFYGPDAQGYIDYPRIEAVGKLRSATA